MLFASCSDEYDDSALTGRVDNLENRVAKLEELCKQMNTNISSLQTIVTALQKNDYVTNVTPIMQNGKEVGYTITFSKSNPITIIMVRMDKTDHSSENRNSKSASDDWFIFADNSLNSSEDIAPERNLSNKSFTLFCMFVSIKLLPCLLVISTNT